MEEWQAKEIERVRQELSRDDEHHFDDIVEALNDVLGQTSQDIQNECKSDIAARMKEIVKEIVYKDPELIGYTKEISERRASLEAVPAIRLSCAVCKSEIDRADTFLMCTRCEQSTGQLQTGCAEPGCIMCHSCYLHGAEHDHDIECLAEFAMTELTSTGCMPRRVLSHDLAIQRRAMQMAAHGEHESPGPRFTDYKNRVQMRARPLSSMLHCYLASKDLSEHLFIGEIKALNSMGGFVTSQPSFQLLKNWAIACFLAADQGFFQRTGLPSFLGILSPIQQASFRMLKEWWFSEIQDPKLMQSTIASFIADSMIVPGKGKTFEWWANAKRNKYHGGYHGALEKLFSAEFGTFANGNPTGASMNLFANRTQAGIEACIQRTAYAGLHPSMHPTWWDHGDSAESERSVRMECLRWRLDIRLACAELLMLIRRTGGPEDSCWTLINMATDSPAELFVVDRFFNEQVFGPKRLTVTLAPLPWLPESQIYDSFPHFLWDARMQQTIETASLGFRPEYVAVSHTWGRWKRHSEPSLKIAGVPWLVPQNDLWDVASLPQELIKVPGRYRFVWFDLVCIPQDPMTGTRLSEIGRRELSKQAAIFGNAARATVWLSTVEDLEFTSLRNLLLSMAMASGKFFDTWKACGTEPLHPNANPEVHHIHKYRLVKESMPLVREDRRLLVGTGADPIEYIQSWFTSLWTLQEACMRPDMWICQKDWTPLRLRDTVPWQSHANLSLDSILALLDKLGDSQLLTRSPLEIYMDDQEREMRPSTEVEIQTPAEKKAENTSSILLKPGAYDGKRIEFPSVDEAMRTGESIDMFKTFSVTGHLLYAMLAAVGLNRLLFISPMDILVLADRRQCKRSRAEAIMSAIGAVDWHKNATTGEKLILNRYPLSFVEEIRAKVGDGEFFKSRLLNHAAQRMAEEFTKTGHLPAPVGTVLPFGSSSTFGASHSPARFELDPEQQESHLSLRSWRIQLNGSIFLSEVGILASTGGTTELCDCLDVLIDESGVYEKSEKMTILEKGKQFHGHPKEWIKGRSYSFYFVCVDWVERYFSLSTIALDSSISNGLVLRELKPGYLVKIGSYRARGHKEHVFPKSERVKWTVL